MGNVLQARVILRHGNNADFDSANIETAELVFAEDLGILYIKKKDGTVLAVGQLLFSRATTIIRAALIRNSIRSSKRLRGQSGSNLTLSKTNTSSMIFRLIPQQEYCLF